MAASAAAMSPSTTTPEERDYEIHYCVISLQTTNAAQPIANTNATFTPFRRLPLELRLEIFSLALPGPRVAEFMRHARYLTNRHKTTPYITSPALLATNHESRTLALTRYTPCFSHYTHNQQPIWMDFTRDILLLTVQLPWRFLLGSPTPGRTDNRDYLKSVQNIALACRPFWELLGLELFAGLRKVTFSKGDFAWVGEGVELVKIARLKGEWAREAADPASEVEHAQLEVLQLGREEFMRELRWDGSCDM